MKCINCGKEINTLLINMFNYDGTDRFYSYPITECEGAIVIETDKNWTGYELSDEERIETIVCPNCKKFPLKSKAILESEILELVMFKTEEEL
ncbi:hypothetical protein [Holdemania massiliensis]|uniref:hypothetical protein n=1 Tax=Holdemania massiliensis TaxID=1468449 RepID=UPI00356276F7